MGRLNIFLVHVRAPIFNHDHIWKTKQSAPNAFDIYVKRIQIQDLWATKQHECEFWTSRPPSFMVGRLNLHPLKSVRKLNHLYSFILLSLAFVLHAFFCNIKKMEERKRGGKKKENHLGRVRDNSIGSTDRDPKKLRSTVRLKLIGWSFGLNDNNVATRSMVFFNRRASEYFRSLLLVVSFITVVKRAILSLISRQFFHRNLVLPHLLSIWGGCEEDELEEFERATRSERWTVKDEFRARLVFENYFLFFLFTFTHFS